MCRTVQVYGSEESFGEIFLSFPDQASSSGVRLDGKCFYLVDYVVGYLCVFINFFGEEKNQEANS